MKRMKKKGADSNTFAYLCFDYIHWKVRDKKNCTHIIFLQGYGLAILKLLSMYNKVEQISIVDNERQVSYCEKKKLQIRNEDGMNVVALDWTQRIIGTLIFLNIIHTCMYIYMYIPR